MKDGMVLGRVVTAFAHRRMDNKTVKNLWKHFCLTESTLQITPCEEWVFRGGATMLPALPERAEFALRVDERGFAVVGRDYSGLMHGFMALILNIEYVDRQLLLRSAESVSHYMVERRMIHFCVFPETDLYFIKKAVRLAAVCQYTHVVLEFWGMLRHECHKELAWPQAFGKTQMGEVIRECRDLGLEPIPMLNQLGHASASRLYGGKHVVLDQNPTLQYLFTPDGWAYNIECEEVPVLLRQMRRELYDLFGEGTYLHIGCDEAYYISRNAALRKKLPAFLGQLTREVEQEGRRPMLWMDMLLERDIFPDCYTVGEKGEVERLRNSTAPSTVFVDWQYDCFTAPIPSLLSLKGCGRDVIGAPWLDPRNYGAMIDTVAQNGFFGVMLTTWHRLKDEMPSVLGCAKRCGAVAFVWSPYSDVREETAALMRRVSFEGNAYGDSGWAKTQIEV